MTEFIKCPFCGSTYLEIYERPFEQALIRMAKMMADFLMCEWGEEGCEYDFVKCLANFSGDANNPLDLHALAEEALRLFKEVENDNSDAEPTQAD
ncbi:MAG: hypothetical protein ABIG63_16485 [Chloroflexota bacterium]